ncbi:shikimate 5-dehydrogenase [Rhodococcus rhodnii]|uniref:Shikimate 5-dehydrogenase n=2 Tax=Rhodococcus rhodnii TaxID=38312 RepID=R7WI98_9NOCA|nr:shikimate 5-dehydrogenase [Rhodococcus rhodnii]EOM74906.1 shikimate 5-dehydrogenase [Rhodococcus rhodnii LMG 5362]TXG91652.1 shikimate 5-dehydrogenase [Rhodococcus rhodnii]
MSEDLRVHLDRDTTLCISLSGRPSNIGTRFHNYLYRELGLNYVYKAFTTADLAGAVTGIRALGIRGAGVSMPFKEAVIDLVDELDPSAAAIDSVNTIVSDDGRLRAYNTDYTAVRSLLEGVPQDASVAVAGSGGMAKAVVAALHAHGLRDGTVVARNDVTGPALARRYDFAWEPELGGRRPDVLVNATPIGMAGGPDASALPFSLDAVESATTVFDVVAMPSETPLLKAAAAANKTVISGASVIALQAAEQFALYTGVRPTDEQIRRASTFSRE